MKQPKPAKVPPNPCPQMRASPQYIDPAWAARLLSNNMEHQRTISTSNLRKIENSLRDDTFMMNGEPIITSEDGKLLNGQHRCMASINTGIGFWTLMVSGIPEEYAKYMDNGKSRNFADVLKTVVGHRNSNAVLAATVARLAEYLKDPMSVGSGTLFAHSELLDVHEMTDNLDESVRAVGVCKKYIAPSQCAWLHYVLNEKCPEQCSQFFTLIGTTGYVPTDSPVHLLRLRMKNDKANGFHPTQREMQALLVKTWNAYAQGQTMKQLRWVSDSEDFPVLYVPESQIVHRDSSAA